MALNRVSKVDDRVKVSNVLLSVSDKNGLGALVEGLLAVNPEVKFYSTGGTYAHLQSLLGDRAERSLKAVSDYTGQPEMQGGLVKTLDFKIYMGLLSETYNDAHRLDLKRTACIEFDLVVVNLYPFQNTIAQPGVTLEDARAHIDIGGPCMLRASAKNFLRVASVCDPADYPSLLTELKAQGATLSLATRFSLAKKSFAHTAAYDSAIAAYLLGQTEAQGLYQFGVR
jgi:phosphoribosylaminoimidazolecarboxamide formyltransferase/IMP cyclohydrolase